MNINFYVDIKFKIKLKYDVMEFYYFFNGTLLNDLSFAKVYFTVFDMSKKGETIKALEKAKSFIRGEISKRIKIRHTPELRFIFDDSIEYGNKIEKLINDINNK